MKLEQIDGNTRLYAILGDPISAVRSPEVFNATFAALSMNAVFIPVHVAAEDLACAWAGLTRIRNMAGLVVTMPHKARVAALLDEVGLAGQVTGAINAARRDADGRWCGDMFDGVGFVDGLVAQGHRVAGWSVRLHGLGGAGTAIALALAESGVGRLALHDLDADRSDRLSRRLAAHFPHLHVSAGPARDDNFDAVVNATPLGMSASDPLPFDPAGLPPATLVIDAVTKPEMTPLLLRAAETGHRVHTGKHMHLGQARRVAEFFGFRLAPTDPAPHFTQEIVTCP